MQPVYARRNPKSGGWLSGWGPCNKAQHLDWAAAHEMGLVSGGRSTALDDGSGNGSSHLTRGWGGVPSSHPQDWR